MLKTDIFQRLAAGTLAYHGQPLTDAAGLAEALGYDEMYLGRLRRGDVPVTEKFIGKLFSAFGAEALGWVWTEDPETVARTEALVDDLRAQLPRGYEVVRV
jgi:hypothetical protein